MYARHCLISVAAVLLCVLSTRAAVVRIERERGICGGTLTGHAVDQQRGLTRMWSLDAGASRIELPGGVEWHLSLLEPSRCWAQSLKLSADASDVVWRIVAGGEVVGRVATAEGETIPSSVSLRFEVPPRKQEKTLATVSCPVDRHGAWSCRVPAGELDLRVGAEGFAPAYLWGVRVEEEVRTDVGAMHLSRGASVAGWVTGDAVDPSTVRVHLEPVRAFDGDEGSGDGPGAMHTRPSARGFFQFTEVPDGLYVVTAVGEHVSSAQRTNVKVTERGEVVLDPPLEVRPFARAEINITPPLDPRGQPWRVTLQRRLPASTYLAEPIRGTMEEGRWTAHNLRPGAYVLRITDGSGIVQERREIEVDSQMTPLFVTMAVVPVKGIARAGTRGLEATIELSSLTGGKAELKSDEDGRFEGYLPAEGRWNVRLRLTSGRQTVRVRSVEVRRRDGEPHARVDLQLPGGIIRGKVTDEQGKAAPASVYVLYQGLPRTSATADDSGEFELIGVDEGSAMIEARYQKKESGLVPVSVSDSTAPVTLVLKAQATIEAWVTTASGFPVGGAAVRMFSPHMSSIRETVTSPSGRFTMQVPASVHTVTASIVAPNLPAVPTTIQVADDKRVDIIVPESAGGLLLRGLKSRRPWVAYGQAVVPLGLLFQPAYGGQSPSVTSEGFDLQVAPGQYLLCPTPAVSDHCTRHWVSAGARVIVDFSNTGSSIGGSAR